MVGTRDDVLVLARGAGSPALVGVLRGGFALGACVEDVGWRLRGFWLKIIGNVSREYSRLEYMIVRI